MLCVLLCSWKYDDLMQFINDELIQRHKNLLEMGEAVLEESISRAITNFGAKHYDDACLVVWQFTPTRPQTLTPAQQQQQQKEMDMQEQQQASANGSSHSTSSSASSSSASSADSLPAASDASISGDSDMQQ